MLEVVATTPSKPLAGCVVVRLDMVPRSSPGSWVVAARRGKRTRAVATNFYTPKPVKFPTWPCKTKGRIRSRDSGLRLRKRFTSCPPGTDVNAKVHSPHGNLFLV